MTEFELKLTKQIKAKNAMMKVVALESFGDRFVGSQGDKRAIDWVCKEFSSMGLKVIQTDINVPAFEDKGSSVCLLHTGEMLDTIPAYFSLPCQPFETDLVYCGSGEEYEYEGLNVYGKIVVINEIGLGYSRFWLGTFAKIAQRKGAAGMIVIHPMPWPYRISMEAGNSSITNRFLPERLPALTVSALDGLKLLKSIGEGNTRVRYESDVWLGMKESKIISGIHEGIEPSLKAHRVGILGHRDNGIAPGANDNGSGSATMLELASVLSKHEFKRSIEFISSTAEEGVTQGIYEYIELRKEDLQKNMIALFDLDMFAIGGKLKLVEIGQWPDQKDIIHSEPIMRSIEEIAGELGYEVGRMTAGWGVAESGRFLNIGVPAVWFWKPDDPYYHSIYDKSENVDGNLLKVVGDLTAVAAARLLNQ